MRGVVVDLLGVHRTDDANIIGDPGDVRKKIRDFLARLTVFLEFGEGTASFEFRILQLCQLLALGERLREWLPVDAFQFRFVIERFQVGRPAGHAQMDDSFGVDGEVWWIDDAFPLLFGSDGGLGASDEFRVEERGERQTAESISGAAEEGASIDVELEFAGIKESVHDTRKLNTP
jgi:hypothetical protein